MLIRLDARQYDELHVTVICSFDEMLSGEMQMLISVLRLLFAHGDRSAEIKRCGGLGEWTCGHPSGVEPRSIPQLRE